eukprot:7921991-Heterocapsa_arctica.AAC.1
MVGQAVHKVFGMVRRRRRAMGAQGRQVFLRLDFILSRPDDHMGPERRTTNIWLEFINASFNVRDFN